MSKLGTGVLPPSTGRRPYFYIEVPPFLRNSEAHKQQKPCHSSLLLISTRG